MKRPITPKELLNESWLTKATKTMNDQDIGKFLGCSPFTVMRWRMKLGIPASLIRPQKNNPFIKSRIKITSKADAAYLAGIIDGEGHVSIHPRKDRGDERLSLCVVNTNKELIDLLGKFGGKTRLRSESNGRLGSRPLYEWVVYSVRDQLTVLKVIYPYSISKKNVIKEAIIWCEARLSGDKSHLDVK